MPSGLLQTVLCDEKLQKQYSRIDELFYYTMKEIVHRIETDASVAAPVDNSRDLTPRKSDIRRMINWKNRLKSKIEDLEILFKEECSREDAMQAWYGFFNHEYWNEQMLREEMNLSVENSVTIKSFVDTEQFIEQIYDVKLLYSCNVSCDISGDGWRSKPIAEFLSLLSFYLPHNLNIRCNMKRTNCPEPYQILWKVRNVGPEAERRNQIRGQIYARGNTIVENSKFYGNHYIECYIIKDNVCVARKRIDVPIGKR